LGPFGVAGNPGRAFAASNPAWSFGIAAPQTVFNGGLTGAQVAAAQSTYESSVAIYRQTVLTAFQQVETK
jgi:outer membrane protein TolC